LSRNTSNKTSKNKALLILDNVPSHPVNNEDKADNTEDILMPPNMTSLLQPMDEGVLVSSKTLGWGSMRQQLNEKDSEDKSSVWEFWRGYYIKKTTDNICASCKVTQARMNALWWKIYGCCAYRNVQMFLKFSSKL
jgi:hypothetical protein